jgi:hypothetical protein
MKKLLPLLTFLVSLSLSAFSQVILVQNWEVLANDANSGTITTNGEGQTSLAYNPMSGNLLLGDKQRGLIRVLDATNGSEKATLTNGTTAEWSNTYRFVAVRVTEDGVIYATNRNKDAPYEIYVYRWASEADMFPQVVATISPGDRRSGEGLAVTGTGTNTAIYISNFQDRQIYMLTTTNGINFTLANTINANSTNVGADGGIRSIDGVPGSTDLWLEQLGGIRPTRYSVTGSALTAGQTITNASTNYAHVKYFEVGKRKFVVSTGANPATDPATAIKISLFEILSDGTNVLLANNSLSNSSPNVNGNAYADGAVRINTDGTATVFQLLTGTGLAAYTTSTTLPVQLSSFSASLKNNQNTLNWTTASEQNNKGFEIERSADNRIFVKIGFVSSNSATGNANATNSYSFVDFNAPNGTSYYRLKQTDFNGDFRYSDVKFVKNHFGNNEHLIYPNPTTAEINLRISRNTNNIYSYKLVDVNGKTLLMGKAEEVDNKINIQQLPRAIYYLILSEGDNQIKSFKVIKN